MKEDIAQALTPAFVTATLGTTGLCAFDDLKTIVTAVKTVERIVSNIIVTKYIQPCKSCTITHFRVS